MPTAHGELIRLRRRTRLSHSPASTPSTDLTLALGWAGPVVQRGGITSPGRSAGADLARVPRTDRIHVLEAARKFEASLGALAQVRFEIGGLQIRVALAGVDDQGSPERAGPARQLDRPPAVAPCRAHGRPL